jgi:hypothetical protein
MSEMADVCLGENTAPVTVALVPFHRLSECRNAVILYKL